MIDNLVKIINAKEIEKQFDLDDHGVVE